MATLKFGTDGWRAVIGDEYTEKNVRVCARALAGVLKDNNDTERGIIVGFDTRTGSEQFARVAADTLADCGIDVLLFDRPAPTPACSFFVASGGRSAGVVITASHNPPEWNGFKIKAANGGTAPQDFIDKVEHKIAAAENKNTPLEPNLQKGTVRTFNPRDRYQMSISGLANLDKILSSSLSAVIDAMHGSGGGVLPSILSGGSLRVQEIRSQPDPKFPGMHQPEPVEANLRPLIEVIKNSKADVGFALDGDADRLGVVDENGRYMSTLEVFTILVHHFLKRKGMTGGVACTLTMSSMVDTVCSKYRQPVHRTSVGFKHVGAKMLEQGCFIGGEESGGYAFKEHVPERDGSASALFFLEAMALSGQTPSQLLEEVQEIAGKLIFRRIDFKINQLDEPRVRSRIATETPDFLGGARVKAINRMDGTRFDMGDGAWVAARMSGTEPLVRFYAEAHDATYLDALLSDVKVAIVGRP